MSSLNPNLDLTFIISSLSNLATFSHRIVTIKSKLSRICFNNTFSLSLQEVHFSWNISFLLSFFLFSTFAELMVRSLRKKIGLDDFIETVLLLKLCFYQSFLTLSYWRWFWALNQVGSGLGGCVGQDIPCGRRGVHKNIYGRAFGRRL